MTETAEEYKSRFASYTEGEKSHRHAAGSTDTLAQLIDGVAETKLRLRPAPGRWPVTEILAHLAG
jgi:hypothetical protein